MSQEQKQLLRRGHVRWTALPDKEPPVFVLGRASGFRPKNRASLLLDCTLEAFVSVRGKCSLSHDNIRISLIICSILGTS